MNFDELNKLQKSKYEKDFDYLITNTPTKHLEQELIDYVQWLLVQAYVFGAEYSNQNLQADEQINTERMGEVINSKVANKTFQERIHEYLDEYQSTEKQSELDAEINLKRQVLTTKLLVLADNETHRVYNHAGFDVATEFQRKNTALTVLKVWKTQRDERVRETHDFLESVAIPLNEKFTTIDLDTARYPSDFTKPENNIGCRCWNEYVVRQGSRKNAKRQGSLTNKRT